MFDSLKKEWKIIKSSFKDPRTRKKYIILLLVTVILWVSVAVFSWSVDGYSVSGVYFRVRFQNTYGGVYYPTNVSDGFSGEVGKFYQFYRFSVVDANGDPVPISTSSTGRYLIFEFDLSDLNLSYDYDISIFQASGRTCSFDGYLTTAHTFGGDDLSVSTDTTVRYNGIVFSPSGVSWSSTSSTSSNLCVYTTGLNAKLQNGVLSVAIEPSHSTSSLSTTSFSFLISLSGSDFQQLLYRAGVNSTSDDYFQLLDDVSSALASGDITPDQAAIINDTAQNTQNQQSINNITEAQAALDSVIQRFISTSGNLIGPDLSLAYETFNDQLYSTIQTYMALITDPAEAAALSSLYDVATKTLESAYTQLVSTRFYNSVSATNQTYEQYHQNEQYLIDNIKNLNLSNALQITSWADTLTSDEKSSFQLILNSFLSNYSWSIFLQIPLYMTVIINLLGTARSKEE